MPIAAEIEPILDNDGYVNLGRTTAVKALGLAFSVRFRNEKRPPAAGARSLPQNAGLWTTR
jgi:hypothetical protein